MTRLERVADTLPPFLDGLREEACLNGYRMLDRLTSEWVSGTNRFDRPGEALLAAYADDVLAGIGGLTLEPAIAGALRMRRFYVRIAYRRLGIARALAEALLADVRRSGRRVTANAAPGSEPFWEALGFAREQSGGYTHILR